VSWQFTISPRTDCPRARVFVKTTLDNGDLVSVSASHELVEMLVDPAINLMTTGPDQSTIYAYESADPVEALSFDVNGIQMSDFVYPSYFEDFRQPGSVQFDQMNQVNAPFQILQGGYQIIFKDGQWSQIFASRDEAKKKAFAREDRDGHRSEQRTERAKRRAATLEPRQEGGSLTANCGKLKTLASDESHRPTLAKNVRVGIFDRFKFFRTASGP
jgi:hypothetical protein